MIGLLLTAMLPLLGAVLLLIGREYHDATEAAAKEASDLKAHYERSR